MNVRVAGDQNGPKAMINQGLNNLFYKRNGMDTKLL
jgi:hypothetical protein